MGELDAIRRLRARWPAIGDDAAVLPGGLLVAADAVVAGVDFTASTPLADVGWRAVVVNVSDIAAMGGRPEAVLVTVVGPDVDLGALYEGIDEACETHGCEVVGGDLSGGSELVVAVTILGRADRPLRRSGARPGDLLYVTGPLGHGAASGYTERPVALVGRGLGATAMIDVSDGLAIDLWRLCDESGVGAVVDDVPVAAGATEEQAWTGGDDYELLFTGPPGLDGTVIGRITDDVSQRPAPAGWQHPFS